MPCGISSLAMLCASPDLASHCEGGAQREALQGGARVGEHNRAFRAIGPWRHHQHPPRRFLAHEERAERRILERAQHEVGCRLGKGFAQDAGNATVDVMDDEGWSANIVSNALKECGDGRWVARITRKSAYPPRFLKDLEDGLVRVPRRNSDTHSAAREQPGAAGADAGPAADDKGDFGTMLIRYG